MNNKIKPKLLVLVFFSCINLFGQEAKDELLPNIIPPSPNAASLGEYTDVPVSNYTGVPQISIPLYNITSGAIELPITLDYHASGIKVRQEASWVGLGWSLKAGGVISRQIRGIDDFHFRGYIDTEEIPDEYLKGFEKINNLDEYSYFDIINYNRFYGMCRPNEFRDIYDQKIFKRQADIEPDIFFYNFLGHSGKFIFQKQKGDLIEATLLEQKNLKILYHRINKEWLVIDNKGYEYTFKDSEYTRTDSRKGLSFPEETTFTSVTPYGGDGLSFHISMTSWYISKVKTPKGDEIRFVYDNPAKYATAGQCYAGEKKYYTNNCYYTFSCGRKNYNGNRPFKSKIHLKKSTQQVVADVYLKRIEFNEGSLVFTTNDRLDMKALSNYTNPQKLKTIELFDLKGESIKKITLKYNYFDFFGRFTSTNSSRLKLLSVQESFGEKVKPPYTFTYNATNLPKKLSFEIDHWGYYNDKKQNTLIPTDYDLGSNKVKYAGANRESSEEHIKACSLQGIQYPTGGKVAFTFEPHIYFKNGYKYSTLYAFAADEASMEDYKKTTFTLTQRVLVNLKASFRNDDWTNQTNANCSGNNNSIMWARSWLKDANGNVIRSFRPPNDGTYYQKEDSITLQPGTYYLETDNADNDCLEATVNANYFTKTVTSEKKGGGLRVKSILFFDNNNDVIKKKQYDYSLGELMTPINYKYEEVNNACIKNSPAKVISFYSLVSEKYFVFTSEGLVPLAGDSPMGNNVGYDEVTIRHLDSNQKTIGKSIYNYVNNNEDLPISQTTPQRGQRYNNGALLAESHFNTKNKPIKKKTIAYKEENESEIRILTFLLGGSAIISTFPSFLKFYDIASKWWHPATKTELVYDVNGENPIETVTNYFYDNSKHKQLTKTETTTSNGKTITKKLYYPDDVMSTTSLPGGTLSSSEFNAIKRLQTPSQSNPNGQHQIGEVVQEVTEVSGNASTLSKRNNYANWTGKILPISIQTSKSTQPLEDRVVYHRYDSHANPLEISQKDGPHTVYLYGYTQQYPIAKIENARFSEVATALGVSEDALEDFNESNLSQINALRAQKPEWMITTYTHIPLVGMETVTDPKGLTTTYEYDDFNRLKYAKDWEGNILSKNNYHYKY